MWYWEEEIARVSRLGAQIVIPRWIIKRWRGKNHTIPPLRCRIRRFVHIYKTFDLCAANRWYIIVSIVRPRVLYNERVESSNDRKKKRRDKDRTHVLSRIFRRLHFSYNRISRSYICTWARVRSMRTETERRRVVTCIINRNDDREIIFSKV